MTAWWQHLPEHIDPIAFTVGFFSVHWYALFWLLGFIGIWYVAKRLRRKDSVVLTEKEWSDVLPLLFLGALLGGHLGYGLLYQPVLFLSHPIQFFFPYDTTTHLWTGIRGMSFYGGLLGVAGVLFWYAKRQQKIFFILADQVVLLAPLAIFFGRLGNFLNQELPGRLTRVPWGMYFPDVVPVGTLRHPSTLYEASLEGVLLFVLLFFLAKKVTLSGQLTASFLIGYGLFRFIGEFFRELDPGSGFFLGILTFGQVLSVGVVFLGVMILFWLERKRHGTIGV